MSDRRFSMLAIGLGLAFGCHRAPEPTSRHSTDINLARDWQVIEARVPRLATFEGILASHEIQASLASRVVEALADAFDPRRIRADQPYRLERTEDGRVRRFEYEIDRDHFVRVSRVPDADGFRAAIVPYEKRRDVLAVAGEITSDHPSLVAALDVQGEQVPLAVAVAEIFAGQIDFTNDLQPGDSFEVLYEKIYREDTFAGYGDVQAATFTNEGKTSYAIRFTVPGKQPGYYDEQGRSLKRFFLRSPLKFEPRITSGFSFRRLHPVLGVFRSHPAIDYGAPRGAPVVAVASGTVVRARYSGGGGNTVVIRHANGYESYYLHLSSFGKGIRPGARVEQGQVIGRVGSTGLATGPHLDYRLKRNGHYVNPLTEHRKLPPGEPIPASARAAFEKVRDEALARLRSVGHERSGDLVAAADTGAGESGPVTAAAQ